MKLTKLFIAGMFAFALLLTPAFAGDSCCDKAKAKTEECKHKCCVDAKKDGKTCEKCNSKKSEEKK